MISIIICSRSKNLSADFIKNISETTGTEFELICIDNSDNRYSIFSAYNEGVRKSKYPLLCFVHDDVYFHTKNWGLHLLRHLSSAETGIIGLAGGDLVTRIPASWLLSGVSINIIETDKHSGKKTIKSVPVAFQETKRSAVLLDGVFLAMRRDIFEKIYFDEQIKGFHGYDIDISLQSVAAGYTNQVIYDISLEHFSKGVRNDLYYRNLIQIFKKWENLLPIFGENITETEKNNLHKIEKKTFV